MSYSQSYSTAPSAPPAPTPPAGYPYQPQPSPPPPQSSYYYGQTPPSYGQAPTAYAQPPTAYAQPPTGYGQGQFPGGYGGGYNPSYSFPPGTHPDVIRNFQMVDMDRSGFIDERELQQALTSGYQRFSLRTIRLLIFLFADRKSPHRIGPKEFAELWSALGQWRGIFERFDRDRSGKIDAGELKDALYSLGFVIPPSVLQLLISRYDDGSGRRADLSFDSFVECGLIIKGLTEKFKEKDTQYIGWGTAKFDLLPSPTVYTPSPLLIEKEVMTISETWMTLKEPIGVWSDKSFTVQGILEHLHVTTPI